MQTDEHATGEWLGLALGRVGVVEDLAGGALGVRDRGRRRRRNVVVGRPEWYLGRVSLSPALPLGVALVALIGPRNLGFSRRSLLAWREFLLLGGADRPRLVHLVSAVGRGMA